MITILIADDTEINRTVLTNQIHTYMRNLNLSVNTDYSIELAFDGKEAFEIAKKQIDGGSPFDIIFMDFEMPKSNGEHATQKIRHYENGKGSEHSHIVTWSTVKTEPYTRNSMFKKIDAKLEAESVMKKPATRDDITTCLDPLIKKYKYNEKIVTPPSVRKVK